MRRIFAFVCFTGLVACAPPPPDDPIQGVGFGNYDTYLSQQAARDAELRRSATQTIQPPDYDDPSSVAADAVAAVRGDSVITETRSASTAPAPDLNNPSISDEQDFSAVSSRQSIQSDAERLKAQREQYQVIAPTSLPSRPRGVAPTPIEFALETSHPVGAKKYRRSGLGSRKLAEKCAGYRSAEQAQDAFLQSGGPDRDKFGIDPDGDGYACSWNPSVYRNVRGN